MSMTKRYLESLPVEEQDAILGGPDYFQRLAAEPMPASPIARTAPAPAERPKCSKCEFPLDAIDIPSGICAYCAMRADRSKACDCYYGWR